MEFLRFGSSIPGSYGGCCAMCIIQDFKQDPDDKASIQIVSGDGGQPIGDNFAGLTYREIFETRLRIGTFDTNDMPNHGFLAILTEWQVTSSLGKKWLKILHENGFEFIRTVDNSVYSGSSLEGDGHSDCCGECYEYECEYESYDEDSDNKNYLFGLFRNIGNGSVADPFTPPDSWTELTGGVKQAIDYVTPNQRATLTKAQKKFHRKTWEKLGPPKFYTKQQVKDAGVTVTLAGQRSKMPQQSEQAREQAQKTSENKKPAKAAPFGGLVSKAVNAVI